MKILFMVLGWLLPPLAFFRRWGLNGGLFGAAIWLSAAACAAYLWAGPGLVVLFGASVLAGALELSKKAE